MCGRFSIFTAQDILAKRFNAEGPDQPLLPHYNAAPSQLLPVILNKEPHKITMAKWGYLPHWLEKPTKPEGLINSRAETVNSKPFFRDAFKKRRCLVLADGFYEWQKTGQQKIPHRITLKSEEPFAFAGIYDPRTDEKGQELNLFSIITTAANPALEEIHNRMPVMLLPENEKIWLENDAEENELMNILQPYPADQIKAYPISLAVNSPVNNTAEVIKPFQ